MPAVTYRAFRRHLKQDIQRIRDDAEPLLVVTHNPEDNIVVMNQDAYDSLMETVRVYRNPVMYARIRRNMREALAGHTSVHALIEDE